MLFNSIQFALFLPIVFLLYWFVFDRFISKSKWQLRLQNAFVVVASYVFYGWWDWRFLLLIALTLFYTIRALRSCLKTKTDNTLFCKPNKVINVQPIGKYV
mgnify:CR=1 FL=1